MKLTINKQTIDLNTFEIQTGKNGKPFRLYATERHDDGWLHGFKYVDGSGVFKVLENQGVFKKLIKN